MAEGIVRAGVDAYAVTNHQGFYPEAAARVEEEVERLLDGTGRKILMITGTELSFDLDGRRFHANHLCRDRFPTGSTPEISKLPCSLADIAQIRKDYPGVTILNHPVRRPGDAKRLDCMSGFVRDSGLFEGLEVANGAILQNTARHRNPRPVLSSAPIQLFQQLREEGLNIAAIGGGDAHRGFNEIPLANGYDSANQVGSAITEYCAATPKGIFEEIRLGRTCAVAVHQEIRGLVRGAINSLSLNGLRRYVRVQEG
jgi:hypothetical protein